MKINFDSKGTKIFLIALCFILLLISYSQRRTRKNYQEAAKFPYFKTSVQQVNDGTYLGKCYASFIHVQLQVTVKDHQLTDIQIIENQGSVGQNVSPIIDEMLQKNATNVQAIKGEELASLAFISCADDALHQALIEQGDYIPEETSDAEQTSTTAKQNEN